jgi:hypothetical protein
MAHRATERGYSSSPNSGYLHAQPEHARARSPQGSRRVSFGDSPTSGFCTPTPGNKRQAIPNRGSDPYEHAAVVVDFGGIAEHWREDYEECVFWSQF